MAHVYYQASIFDFQNFGILTVYIQRVSIHSGVMTRTFPGDGDPWTSATRSQNNTYASRTVSDQKAYILNVERIKGFAFRLRFGLNRYSSRCTQ